MNIHTVPNPVEQAYGGGDALQVRKLSEAINHINSNFASVQSELVTLRLRDETLRQVNSQLIQFVNWLATTNPHILDEFQTTANALEKIAPRSQYGDGETCAPA